MSNRRYALAAFIGYLTFVIYGSLIPFELRELSLDEAVQRFQDIRYLDLGIGSRADWVANIVLYIPLSFLGCVLLMGMRKVGVARQFSLFLVLVGGVAVAVSVEFTQLFFAPRTVSINDLIAETLGTLAGMGLWFFWRRQLCQLWDSFHEGGQQSILAVLYAYFLIYFAQSLFPFDFVVSFDELSMKASGDGYGWLVAGDCPSLLRCVARLVGEGFAIAPLGILIALAFSNISLKRTFVAGLVVGLFIELLQFFLASGVSQGLSVLMRGVGLAAGIWFGQWLKVTTPELIAKIVWQMAQLFFLPYLVVIASLAGWFSGHWLPVSQLSELLDTIKLIPFYYHYYSSEPAAMASLLVNLLVYAPVGLAIWAKQAARGITQVRSSMTPVVLSACLALVVELGKVLVPLKHPDMTSLIIATTASFLVYQFASWIEAILNRERPTLVGDLSRKGG